jgi:hypothetical protein
MMLRHFGKPEYSGVVVAQCPSHSANSNITCEHS